MLESQMLGKTFLKLYFNLQVIFLTEWTASERCRQEFLVQQAYILSKVSEMQFSNEQNGMGGQPLEETEYSSANQFKKTPYLGMSHQKLQIFFYI